MLVVAKPSRCELSRSVSFSSLKTRAPTNQTHNSSKNSLFLSSSRAGLEMLQRNAETLSSRRSQLELESSNSPEFLAKSLESLRNHRLNRYPPETIAASRSGLLLRFFVTATAATAAAVDWLAAVSCASFLERRLASRFSIESPTQISKRAALATTTRQLRLSPRPNHAMVWKFVRDNVLMLLFRFLCVSFTAFVCDKKL